MTASVTRLLGRAYSAYRARQAEADLRFVFGLAERGPLRQAHVSLLHRAYRTRVYRALRGWEARRTWRSIPKDDPLDAIEYGNGAEEDEVFLRAFAHEARIYGRHDVAAAATARATELGRRVGRHAPPTTRAVRPQTRSRGAGRPTPRRTRARSGSRGDPPDDPDDAEHDRLGRAPRGRRGVVPGRARP
jgi:hypothetical protein